MSFFSVSVLDAAMSSIIYSVGVSAATLKRARSQSCSLSLSRVNEEKSRRVGPSPEPQTLSVGVIPLPGGTQDGDNFECIAVVAVVGVQELIQKKCVFPHPVCPQMMAECGSHGSK